MTDQFQNGDYQSIINQVENNQKKLKGSTPANNLCGAAYLKVGNYHAAEIKFQAALEKNPNSLSIINNLALALKGKRIGQLRKKLSQILEEDNQNQAARINLAICCMEEGVISADPLCLNDAARHFEESLLHITDNATVHNNLGFVYSQLKEFTRAVEEYKSDKDYPNYAEAYLNLGNAYLEPDQEQAHIAYSRALELNPNLNVALYKLASIEYSQNKLDEASKLLEKIVTSSDDIDTRFLSVPGKILRGRLKSTKGRNRDFSSSDFPVIFNRPVEPELIAHLRTLDSRALSTTKDARYGAGVCSTGFDLFNSDAEPIKKVSEELIKSVEYKLERNLLHCESFFNILKSGGGSDRHSHVSEKDAAFDLWKNKFSLVYYLDVGDQTGKMPGTLKIFEPYAEILPTNGMCILLPASRDHSAEYDGASDRIMIGLNIYCD